MSRIFIFTAANPAAQNNLRKSITQPLSLDAVLPHFSPELHGEIRDINDKHGLYAWGAVPGERNPLTWGAMQPGDWVLCVYDSAYRYAAKVLAKHNNESFARSIWSTDDSGRTWQYMYFLTKPEPILVQLSKLADTLNAEYRGFTQIANEKIERINNQFGNTDQFMKEKLRINNPNDMNSFQGEIPPGITREHILQGISEWERGNRYGFGDSVDYDLLHDAKRYPPKAVVGIAARNVIGRTLKPSEFVSGRASACFRLLQNLGFEVVEKAAPVSSPAIWIEYTYTKHNHGGLGWEFGSCLWSPSRNRAGSDNYSIMREVADGDAIIHIQDSLIVGTSRAAGSFREIQDPPPEPGNWANMAPYYRIDVRDFTELTKKVSVSDLIRRFSDEIRLDLQTNHPERYPFFAVGGQGEIRTNQGGYLFRCTPTLHRLILEATDANPEQETKQVMSPIDLVGTAKGLEDDLSGFENLISTKGAAACWWSFPIKPEVLQKLKTPFYLYLNTGHGMLTHRALVSDYSTSRGNAGMETPWPDLTHDSFLGKTRAGEDTNQIFKTWLKYALVEKLSTPLTIDDILPYEPFSTRVNILNQSTFGYIHPISSSPRLPADPPYSIEDALKDLFLDRSEFEFMLELLTIKKNVILQGPPGVGKTLLAKRLAHALIGTTSSRYVENVQFHQSYSYEDFLLGYRPTETGNFSLKHGPFYKFCDRARKDPSHKYVFIIDEINRGNLSKIFGEVMLCVEHDKRSSDWAVTLAYSEEGDPKFYIPENVFLLGMMNTADRSLAMLDYALRRRFAFVDVAPGFTHPRFSSYLTERGASNGLLSHIISRMVEINKLITDDPDLRAGFCIGHSYFCSGNSGHSLDTDWYHSIVRTEIAPLIREYWYDKKPEELKDIINQLDLH